MSDRDQKTQSANAGVVGVTVERRVFYFANKEKFKCTEKMENIVILFSKYILADNI